MQVYFAECADRIKIGLTRDVDQRLAQLRTGAAAPLNLIASVAGDRKVEQAIHKKLTPFRILGEWYRDCPEVRAAIQQSVSHFPPADFSEKNHRIPNKFGAVCKVLWPKKTAAHLAAIARTSDRTATHWLSGEFEPPGVILAAIIVEITKRN